MELENALTKLQEENRRLQAELDRHREAAQNTARLRARVAGYATSFAVRFLVGRSLADSIKAWLRSANLRSPVPADETAEVLAAILGRVIRVGFVGLLVAILPMAIMSWQSILMREANAQLRLQNIQIQNQIDQQGADALIVRRAQLIDTIYGEVCKEEPEPEPQVPADSSPMPLADSKTPDRTSDAIRQCRPRAHIRARQEAVRAFAEIEKTRGAKVDLNGANLHKLNLNEVDLSEAWLVDANLSGANLSGANLRAAILSSSNLEEAILARADLTSATLVETDLDRALLMRTNLKLARLNGATLHSASLFEANLRGANLRSANLTGVLFEGADLSKANLAGADLTAADLSKAINLDQDRPSHWRHNLP